MIIDTRWFPHVVALLAAEARAAYDGNAAIELCESFRPHVAVLDIGMPGRSGYDAGFDHHLTKPADPGVLNEMICRP